MSGQAAWSNETRPPLRHLPPLEAWREPDRWFDVATGQLRSDRQRIELPHDDRLIVIPDAAVAAIQDLFWDDYEWPIDKNDPELKPDMHHFHFEAADYLPANNHGSLVPHRFRELPPLIGVMPRQFHNVTHAVTAKPRMPSPETMQQYLDNYALAKRLFLVAKSAMETQQRFTLRRSSIANNPQVLGLRGDDAVGEQILADMFDRHFRQYKDQLEHAQAETELAWLLPNYDQLERAKKPHRVVKALGKYVTGQAINFMPQFRTVAA